MDYPLLQGSLSVELFMGRPFGVGMRSIFLGLVVGGATAYADQGAGFKANRLV